MNDFGKDFSRLKFKDLKMKRLCFSRWRRR